MSMLTREQAESVLALHASGEGITGTSLRLGVSRPTVRSYVLGHRVPGDTPRPKPDYFAPFASYCRQRLTDDPHLSRPLLRQELAGLGYPGSRMSLSRAMDRHELLQLACQNRHDQPPAPVKPNPPGSNGPARPLPITVSPVSGETLPSYLGRVAAANHITAAALLALLPRWFRTKIRDCDDRGQHFRLLPAAAGALRQLAAVTGIPGTALTHALPAFTYLTGNPAEPVRATAACHRCLAADGIRQPVPVLLAAHLRICTRHRLWLPASGLPQLDLSPCPDITAAQHQARRLLRRYTPQQLISAHAAAAEHLTSPATDLPARPANWQQRVSLLQAGNTRPGSRAPSRDQLIAAAIYPDAIALATSTLTGIQH
jgi:TniQ